jgi:hypothetical protein
VGLVHLVRRPLCGRLYHLRMIDGQGCGAVHGMKIGGGNRSTRRKSAPLPLRLPQIPQYLTWARTGAAPLGNRRLTVWAMARPNIKGRDYLVRLRRKWDDNIKIVMREIWPIRTTERRGQVVSTLAWYLGGPVFESWTEDGHYWGVSVVFLGLSRRVLR